MSPAHPGDLSDEVSADKTHSHPVDPDRVARVQQQALAADEAHQVATLLRLLGDGTRIRVLFALEQVEELCVGDIALALDINEDSASYALRQLRSAGLVASRRAGRTIWYRIADGFPDVLLSSCVRSLLELSTTPE